MLRLMWGILSGCHHAPLHPRKVEAKFGLHPSAVDSPDAKPSRAQNVGIQKSPQNVQVARFRVMARLC